MAAHYKKESDGSVSIAHNIKPTGSTLEQEEQIAEAVVVAKHWPNCSGMR